MNSAIAASINGTLTSGKDSLNQKIGNGSRSTILLSNIDFSLTETKKPSSVSNIPGQYLSKLGSSEPLFNGQNKPKNGIDHNRNINKQNITVNGNKETPEDGIPTPKVQLYTGKVCVQWKQVRSIGAGLNNLGNTCFMNTVIQCLTYCPPLANYLLHDNDHSPRCSVTGFCMMCLLQRHMKKAIGNTGEVIKPLDVYQRLKLIAKHFQYGRQEDAHEFLRYVIDNLWKSCLSQNNNCSKLDPASKETTVINQIFGGYHRSQVTCLRCKEKSNTFDHFMDFILDIKQNVMSLEKALEKYIQPEILEQENSYKCPKCKIKVTAQKRFSVYRAPNVATFQLKRFDYNRSFGGKITKQIAYPEKLNLRPYMSESKGEPVWYSLNAVLVHSGHTCNSGHYYCYVKNSNGLWYIMDDTRVYKVGLPQVLNQIAYVLFYIKSEATQAPSFKKGLENQNAVLKGNMSMGNYKKNHELPLKSSPLTVQNQVKQHPSPLLNQKLNSSLSNNKKLSPNLNRERISFGIRASMPNIQELYKSLDDRAANNKIKQSESTSTAGSNHSGLVPYAKDSSESSDESEPVKEGKCKPLSSTNVTAQDVKRPFNNFKAKNINDRSTLDVRRKPSKPIVGSRKFSPSISNSSERLSTHSSSSSTSLKVVATGSWTVTETAAMSPSAASSCSSNSIHSTSDWHVTSTTNEHSLHSSINSKIKENGQVRLSENHGLFSTPTKLDTKTESVTNGNKEHSDSNVKLPGQKSDFRDQQSSSSLNGSTSLQQTERQHQNNSFLKRKGSYSDSKYSENTHSDESRCSSVSKKAKYSEDQPSTVNGINYGNSTASNIENYSSQKAKMSHSSEENSYKSEKHKKKRVSRRNSCPESNVEYVWVEKTNNTTIEPKHKTSSQEIPDKNKYFDSASSKSESKHNVAQELVKNSTFFYGDSVPTWDGKNHYKEIPQSVTERRKSWEYYEDDEFDRGKVRKSKPKDRHHYYRQENPFQERSYNYNRSQSNYNGNFHRRPHNNYRPYNRNYPDQYGYRRQHFKQHHYRR